MQVRIQRFWQESKDKIEVAVLVIAIASLAIVITLIAAARDRANGFPGDPVLTEFPTITVTATPTASSTPTLAPPTPTPEPTPIPEPTPTPTLAPLSSAPVSAASAAPPAPPSIVLSSHEITQLLYAVGIPEFYPHSNGRIYDHQWWRDMIWCESRNNPGAIGAGSFYGLVQSLLSWFPRVGFSEAQWSDPYANLSVGWWLMQNADPRSQWPNCS